jgi:uncharacterized protein (DUF924 family)
MTLPDPRIAAVLDFWFGEAGSQDDGRARAAWFRKDAAFDDTIRERFGGLIDEASAGALDGWAAVPEGALALLIVCDQFSRNLFRGEARSFALDPRALAVSRRIVAAGQDRLLVPVRRAFVYLPFEHSESLDDQRESVRLFATLTGDPEAGQYHEWAVKHLRVIERFGRFPHRNEILGRPSTAEETDFLAQPGSRF